MAEPTISHQRDAEIWGKLLDGARYMSEKRRLVRCGLCRRIRMNYDGPHAELVLPNGNRRNCFGIEVRVLPDGTRRAVALDAPEVHRG